MQPPPPLHDPVHEHHFQQHQTQWRALYTVLAIVVVYVLFTQIVPAISAHIKAEREKQRVLLALVARQQQQEREQDRHGGGVHSDPAPRRRDPGSAASASRNAERFTLKVDHAPAPASTPAVPAPVSLAPALLKVNPTDSGKRERFSLPHAHGAVQEGPDGALTSGGGGAVVVPAPSSSNSAAAAATHVATRSSPNHSSSSSSARGSRRLPPSACALWVEVCAALPYHVPASATNPWFRSQRCAFAPPGNTPRPQYLLSSRHTNPHRTSH